MEKVHKSRLLSGAKDGRSLVRGAAPACALKLLDTRGPRPPGDNFYSRPGRRRWPLSAGGPTPCVLLDRFGCKVTMGVLQIRERVFTLRGNSIIANVYRVVGSHRVWRRTGPRVRVRRGARGAGCGPAWLILFRPDPRLLFVPFGPSVNTLLKNVLARPTAARRRPPPLVAAGRSRRSGFHYYPTLTSIETVKAPAVSDDERRWPSRLCLRRHRRRRTPHSPRHVDAVAVIAVRRLLTDLGRSFSEVRLKMDMGKTKVRANAHVVTASPNDRGGSHLRPIVGHARYCPHYFIVIHLKMRWKVIKLLSPGSAAADKCTSGAGFGPNINARNCFICRDNTRPRSMPKNN
ncbi:hypothetical protein EVAR_78405_1 [Eumeta japonica]|uniref:Uncharacterized protein n=1 Tax=Eumeta variegata TaxID=151549 RepID=A0A4C1T4G8_EUMVA|nr:hypothetical protein EVAR_78405_1 [Eumeta japonica]